MLAKNRKHRKEALQPVPALRLISVRALGPQGFLCYTLFVLFLRKIRVGFHFIDLLGVPFAMC